MSKELSCEERIENEYLRQEEYLELVFKVLDDYEFDEDDEDEKKQLQEIKDDPIDSETIYEIAAGSNIKKLLTIVLSGGGPSSHIEAIIDEDGYVESAKYVFLDWFDGATRKIPRDSAMFRFVEWEAERYA
jgi:hypothetical protein